MFSLFELKDDRSQCRFPLTAGPPHFFCGEPVSNPPYCDHCRRVHKPFTGELGKAWQGLAGMMDATEQTITRKAQVYDTSAVPLDEVVRESEAHFDEAGGLMRRT